MWGWDEVDWLGHLMKGFKSQAEEPGDLVLRVMGAMTRFCAEVTYETAVRGVSRRAGAVLGAKIAGRRLVQGPCAGRRGQSWGLGSRGEHSG